MKKGEVLLLALGMVFFSMHCGFAHNFTVEAECGDYYLAGEKYTIPVKVTNYGESGYFSFTLVSSRPRWFVLEKLNLYVESGKTETMKIHFSPSPDALEAVYKVKLVVKAEDGSRREKTLFLEVRQPEKIKVANVTVKPERIAPGKSFRVQMEIINMVREPQKVKIRIEYQNERKEDEVVVKGRTKKRARYEFSTGEREPPGKRKVSVEVFHEGTKIFSAEREVEIERIEKVEVREEVKEENILFRKVVIFFENSGNVEKEAEIRSSGTNAWYSLYLGKKPEISNGYYVWRVALSPGEKGRIEYTEFYWPVVVFPLIAIAVLICVRYLCFRGVKIRKVAITRGRVREGDVISISIEIRNRGRTAKSLVVEDIVPLNFELVKKFETIKPMRKETENGILLKWKIRALKPGEERVLHYKMRAKIGIIGKIKLPRARVEYKRNGKVAKCRSNSPEIEGTGE